MDTCVYERMDQFIRSSKVRLTEMVKSCRGSSLLRPLLQWVCTKVLRTGGLLLPGADVELEATDIIVGLALRTVNRTAIARTAPDHQRTKARTKSCPYCIESHETT